MNDFSSAVDAGGARVSRDVPIGDTHDWFAALDQRSLAIGAERWLTQVVGIHQDGPDVWIQLQPLREQPRDFTIRVRPGMTVDEVVKSIEALIRDASHHPR